MKNHTKQSSQQQPNISHLENNQPQLGRSQKESKYSKDKMSKKRVIHWRPKENLKYVTFIEVYKEDLRLNAPRRIWKIYKMMSDFIETRDIYQCRSHHQKMIKKYISIQELIEELKIFFSQRSLKRSYREFYQKMILVKKEEENLQQNPLNTSFEPSKQVNYPNKKEVFGKYNIIEQNKSQEKEVKIKQQAQQQPTIRVFVQQKRIQQAIKTETLAAQYQSSHNFNFPIIPNYQALQYNNWVQYWMMSYNLSRSCGFFVNH